MLCGGGERGQGTVGPLAGGPLAFSQAGGRVDGGRGDR